MQEARSVPIEAMDGFPEPGTVRRVAPGILWVRMPLPFALNHINIWLLEAEDGWTIVDTGIGSNRTKDCWERIFRESLAGKPVVRIVATHFHPDHVGLAGWLVDRWQAEFCASLTEWLFGRMLSLESPEAMVRTSLAFYRRAGLDEAALAVMAERGNSYAKGVTPLPARLRRLKAGDRLPIGGTDWHVITGGGHTPEHVCLHCPDRGIFIAGDQVLPRISPNISVWASEPDADPLDDFLRTLDRLRSLPDDLLVLPSHDTPFTGLHARLDALAAHHRERLEEVVNACAEPSTVAQVTRVMFNRPLDPHQLVFAVGEALAHLNHLAARGRLIRRTDRDGLLRFSRP
ncbi:MBL fold metallo-hydrolase [Skermanella sp. TT6]|nr:MBL fold metallo-hydrolase [Skermanella sp. TT6]